MRWLKQVTIEKETTFKATRQTNGIQLPRREGNAQIEATKIFYFKVKLTRELTEIRHRARKTRIKSIKKKKYQREEERKNTLTEGRKTILTK